MAMSKKGLGRGLGALLDANSVIETTTENEKDVKKIKITQIEPNKSQPRTLFDEEKIEELADSIREYGLLQPIVVKLNKNGIPVDYKYCISGKATAYTGDPETSTGRTPMPGHIAVDPKEIPYGTELYVVSADGTYVYGYCIAADTGGFVEMVNTDIDLYMDNKAMCREWGNRNVKIYVLN